MTTAATRTLLLVGSYTDGGPGIHVLDATDPDAGLATLSSLEGIANPSYLAVHPSASVLYAVSETVDPPGSVVALSLDPATGTLVELGRAPSHGRAPCHVAVDAAGRRLHVANYGDGTVAVFSLQGEGRIGELLSTHAPTGDGPHPRQGGPHAHGVLPTDDGVLVTDLGTDELRRYRPTDPDGSGPLVVVEVLVLPPGTGPRHAVRHPSRDLVLVVGELDSTLTLVADPPGAVLRRLDAVSTLPPGGDPATSLGAAVVVSPAGDRVYVSNRGPDTVATFALEGDRATLLATTPSGGRTPRDVALHPDGRHLLVADQDDDLVAVLALDENGVPRDVVARHRVSSPTCVVPLEVPA